MSDLLHDVVAARLGEAGQRYTESRRMLVERLAGGGPMTLPELLEGRPRLPQSSAYRNLSLLEEAGVVHRVVAGPAGDFARFELAEDLTEHHHHLICSSCGAVEDFTAPAGLERSLHKASSVIAADTGFTLERHRLDLIGTCAGCS